MSSSNPPPIDAATNPETGRPRGPSKMRVYSHSPILYWWPVWAVGYVMAAITHFQGKTVTFAGRDMLIHENSNLGLIFFVTLFLVILVTNYAVRGLASGIVIMGVVLILVLLLYFNVWENVVGWVLSHKIYLNEGAYLWISSLLFLLWAVVVFGLDRISYWEIEPGQLTQESLFGSGSKSFNTQGMVLEKHQDDVFRHWLLGIGSGDMRVRTAGATREQLDIHNVMFVGSKIAAMQRLIAESPEE
ncbi:MAG: hypothetical protein ABL921_09550 [Pirellula sp.]